ncbi:hypothetical protein HMPREF9716_03777, partial [Myroides odoratus CIP 103059]
TPTFQNGSLGFCYLVGDCLVEKKKHPTTVTLLKKASTLTNDNGRSVSKR